jgi:exodeoxyribonuclease V gamma subunit
MKKEILFLSNQLEELYRNLKAHLFSPPPLSSLIYVFVPSDKVKQWLMKKIAKEEKILAGIHFCSLSDLFSLFKKESFADLWDLELVLEEELFEMGEQTEEKVDSLSNFLNDNEEMVHKRVLQLAQKLALLFFDYGLTYNSSFFSWEKREGWQEKLWQEIFDKKKWKYPARDLFSLKEKTFEKNVEIHLFAPLFLLPIYREMFHCLSFQYPVYHYLISPTYCFWEDLASDKERRSLHHFWKRKNLSLERREELDDYLQDRNPLLANLGKVERETHKILDREGIEERESYILLQRDSLLHALQDDFLSLVNPASEEKEKIFELSPSVQIHVASSLFREVEILHEALKHQIQDKKICFSDILVLAPDISLYEPFIHQVFGEGEIPYRIFDLPLREKSCFVRALFDFFGLVHSRWKKEDLFRFFENPLLLKKYPLDVAEVRLMFERVGLTWGIDAVHRSLFLETKKETTKKGTWQEAIEALFKTFVFGEEKTDPFGTALFLEKSRCLDLDRFLFLFEQLKEDISFLEKSPFLSIEEATLFFEKVANFYFATDEEKKLEQKAFSLFQETLKKMRSSSKKFENKKFLTDGLFAHLLKEMQGTYNTSTSSLEAVSFHSLKEGSCLPASFVCLMGMGEAFPRNEQKISLNLLEKEKKKLWRPSQNEKDRALFLEALLSARTTLYISLPVDLSGLPKKSLLVEELLGYLENRFCLAQDSLVTTHPLFSFNPLYFAKGSSLHNFSELSFRAAKCFSSEKEEKKNLWKEEVSSSFEETYDIKSFELLSAHPIKFFFQKSLKIFLEEEKKENYTLSFLDRYHLRSLFLKKEKKEILDSIQQSAKFSSGLYFDIIKEEIEKELMSYEENLQQLGVDKKTIFSVDLVEGCEEAFQKENGHWVAPPLEWRQKDRKIKVVGLLDFLSPQGLLCHGKGDFWDLVRIYPRILIYLQLPFLEKGEILFSKKAKKKKIFISDPKLLLASYVDYYEKAKRLPSPLLKEWSQSFFSEEKELQEEIDNSADGKREEDLYLHRFFSLSEKPSASFLQSHWKEILFSVFEPIVLPLHGKAGEDVKDASV